MYKNDPTIIAWNLINEPRCESWLPANKDCNQRVQKWLVEMSKHVKTLDNNHLVTIGSEGFYGDSTPKLLQYNPQAWAADMGQDFVMNADIIDVDFATVHAWPDNCECSAGALLSGVPAVTHATVANCPASLRLLRPTQHSGLFNSIKYLQLRWSDLPLPVFLLLLRAAFFRDAVPGEDPCFP